MNLRGSPLRYPGGKQRLAPFVLEILEANDLSGGDYVEPYAGGAGVAIELLLAGRVRKIHLNDSCRGLFAFWHAVLNHTDDLCARIRNASLTMDEWRRQKTILAQRAEHDLLDLGFATFFLNRCNRSGILSGGVIGGNAQTGEWTMGARFPRNDLIRRVEAIAQHRESISIHNLDAESFILGHVPLLPAKTLVYCDPPYFHRAEGLYLNKYRPADHERIARVIQMELPRPWIVSYDNAPEIKAFYSCRRTFTYDLRYSAAKSQMGKEVFFFSDSVRVPGRSSIEFIDVALLAAA